MHTLGKNFDDIFNFVYERLKEAPDDLLLLELKNVLNRYALNDYIKKNRKGHTFITGSITDAEMKLNIGKNIPED